MWSVINHDANFGIIFDIKKFLTEKMRFLTLIIEKDVDERKMKGFYTLVNLCIKV